MNKQISVTVTVIIAIVVAGLAFYGGTVFASMKPKVAGGPGMQAGQPGANGIGARGGRGGAAGAGGFGNGVAGEVVSKDAQGLTIKLQNGSTEIVLVSGTTKINKTVAGTIADVTVGSTISVLGTSNSDGSVTAQMVQIRPPMAPIAAPTQTTLPTTR